ncbi:DUF4286 family protein [Aldersonia kunmingensis]|uniref:DUF4286 family protein n=1 Tax=Aldersonia kunmingensis TaxID=408066 RepID=UPI000836767D|nr:DUF4286 family protein [Aldersonia kunmingensis]
MAKSILFVESGPASADTVDDYNRWHNEVHVPEMLELDGFVSARRWQDGDNFITLYEIDADVETAKATLKAFFASGTMSKPVGVRTEPPAVMRYLSLIHEATA